MQNTGWITLHRRITGHWIFQDAEKFKAWIAVLLNVNFAESQKHVGNKVFTCKRGQSIRSYASWAKTFGPSWNKQKVHRFFQLLEAGQMITVKPFKSRTLLTVCNYDRYQDVLFPQMKQDADEQRTENGQQADTYNNNVINNENNENKKNVGKIQLLSSLKIDDLNPEEKKYAQIAIGFFRLIQKNLQDEGLSLEKLNQAKANPWIHPIRLMIQKKEATPDQLRLVYGFLSKNEFWKRNILSTKKLREKFPTLFLQAKNQNFQPSRQDEETTELFARDYHDPAETL